MEVGQWELCVNGHRYLGFDVAEGGPSPRSPIVAQFDIQPAVALTEAQELLEALLAAHSPPREIHLRWDHAAITRLLKINGLPLSEDLSTLTFTLGLDHAIEIDADNLGHFVWRNPAVAATVPMQRFPTKYAAASRVQWLLSVARRHNVPDSIRLVVPAQLRVDSTMAGLHGLWLPVKYVPHFNALLTDARTR
jgi:hypothetical protein